MIKNRSFQPAKRKNLSAAGKELFRPKNACGWLLRAPRRSGVPFLKLKTYRHYQTERTFIMNLRAEEQKQMGNDCQYCQKREKIESKSLTPERVQL